MGWWQRLWRRKEMEEQLDRELRFHLEQHVADLIAQGQSPGEARRMANLALGGPEQVKEKCRDARGIRWLEDLLQDFHYTLRTLRRQPGFAAVALLTLALGTGATTVMFTVIDGVLLKPLPFPQPDRLLHVQEQTKGQTDYIWGNLWAFAYPNFLDCQRESRSLGPMAAWRWVRGTVSGSGEAEHVLGIQMSSELFSVLGISPAVGHAFSADDDRPSSPPVALLGYGLWQRRYGGSPAALGTTLVFDGKAYVVVGIAPAELRLFGDLPEIFTPLGQVTGRPMQDRSIHPGLSVFARLRPGVTLPQAQAELDLIAGSLEKQYPQSNAGRTFLAEQLRPLEGQNTRLWDNGDIHSTLWLLLGAVSLVLLIACVNVASLLLARAVSRERELAMRVALGANRSRLVRQCLTESAILGLLGGALGIGLARLGLRPFVLFWPGSLPRAEEVHLNWQVLAVALAVSLLCGLLFGLAPALRVPVRDVEQTLRAGARAVSGGTRRLHSAFVISEIALAVVLLVSAGMLGRMLLHLSALNPGVNVSNLLVTRMGLSPATLVNPSEMRTTWQDILDRAHRIPEVQSVALVDTVPLREGNNQLGYSTTPDVPPRDRLPMALATSVTPEYLKVMGIPLLRGRFFDGQDRVGSKPVGVIDEVMAQHAFPGQDPVGKALWVPDMGPDPFEVVGIVGHVRYWGLAGDDQAHVREQLYYPFAQVPDRFMRIWSGLMSIAVRTSVPPLNAVAPLRRELRGAAGDQVLYEVRTMEQLASASLERQRFLLLLFGIFAGLALLLASVGIYGVLAYVTSRRVPEIGVRMALGASSHDVLQLVLRQSLVMICAGVGLGIAGALAAGRMLERVIAGVRSTEPVTFAVMVLVLMAAALFASFLPARRASHVDPISALRQE